jgi:hypothetical protein
MDGVDARNKDVVELTSDQSQSLVAIGDGRTGKVRRGVILRGRAESQLMLGIAARGAQRLVVRFRKRPM